MTMGSHSQRKPVQTIQQIAQNCAALILVYPRKTYQKSVYPLLILENPQNVGMGGSRGHSPPHYNLTFPLPFNSGYVKFILIVP